MSSTTTTAPPARPSWPRAVGPVVAVEDMDVTQVLHEVGDTLRSRRAAEVRDLELALQFAALHGHDPHPEGSAAPSLRPRGMTMAEWEAARNKLVQVGGDGTPMVQDLPICELAVARGTHLVSTRRHLADALDLAFRLPRTWLALREGRGEPWVVKKVASMSRSLDREVVHAVDAAVAGALAESPGRVLAIAEAAILRADPEAGQSKRAEEQRNRFVAIGQSDEDGLRKVFGRIDAGDAAWLDAMIERLADALAARPDLIPELVGREGGCTRDELRAEALGWLAHPEDAIALLRGTYPVRTDETDPDDVADTADGPPRPSPARQRAVLHVHLHQAAVEAMAGVPGTPGHVARIEELGPLLAEQVRRLLGHAHVVVKPVVDLNTGRSVNGYEHPPDVDERTFLRTTGDVFPHATTQSRRADSDHPTPYDSTGPPGQTGDHNNAPLGRTHHRAKTHLPYDVTQVGLGQYLWRTPHGLYRLVDGAGTHEVDAAVAWHLAHPGAWQSALDRIRQSA